MFTLCAMRARTLAPVAVLALVACSSTDPSPTAASPASPPAASSPQSSPAVSIPSPSASPEPTDSAAAASGNRIGGPAVALPGAKVAVGKPTYYPTSGNDVGVSRTGNTLALYPITITNTGPKPIDATLTAVNAYAGGEQVDGLQDTSHPANNITGTILPGKTKKGTYGFLVRRSDKGTMQVEVYVPTTPAQAHGVFTEPGAGDA